MKNTFRYTLIMICVVVCVFTLSIAASAADGETSTSEPISNSIIDSGTCGNNLKWKLDDSGVLTIRGTGPMYNYNSASVVPWRSYISDFIKTVVISNGVTTIGDYAFYDCDMTKLTIPNSVTTIGNNAVSGCWELTKLIIPNSVTTIGDRAISDCVNLTELTIPSSVTTIGEYAFCGNGLKTVTIPNSVTTIEKGMFFGCWDLTKLTIPNSVTTIGEYAFSNCTSLKTMTIPNSVTTIENNAFYNCWRLTKLTISNRVTTIGNYAFSDCDDLTSLSIPNSVTTIGNYAFSRCKSLTELSLSDGLTSIGNAAFSDCQKLTSLTIPASLTYLGKGAFKNTYSLSSIRINANLPDYDDSRRFFSRAGLKSDSLTVTFGNGVTRIPSYLFANIAGENDPKVCAHITRVVIPVSVEKIGEYAFGYCYDLKSIEFKGSAPGIGSNAFKNVTAKAGYRNGASGWTTEVRQNYGGKLTWVKVSAPKVTTQPKAVTVKAGEKAVFKVKASGGLLTYQWYVMKKGSTKWAKVSGAAKATYSFIAKKTQSGWKYRCLVKNTMGKVYSKTAKLTVK